MEYRKMTQQDKDSVQALFTDMGPVSAGFVNKDHGNERFVMKAFAEPQPTMDFFVATENDRVVGLIFLWDMDKSVPWLGIAVRDAYQGQHVGTELMKYTLADLDGRGYGGVLLTTAQNNFRGQALYEKSGFTKLGFYLDSEFLYLKRFLKK